MKSACSRSIRPTGGLGFAVLEGPNQLLDWGVKQAEEGDKNAKCVGIVQELIDRYRPHVLVLENPTGKSSRRCERVQELLQAVRQAARQKGVKGIGGDALARPASVRAEERHGCRGHRRPLPGAGSTAAQASHAHHERALCDAGFRCDGVAMTYFYFRNRKRLGEERKAIRAALGSV
jgi:hypothetical protein